MVSAGRVDELTSLAWADPRPCFALQARGFGGSNPTAPTTTAPTRSSQLEAAVAASKAKLRQLPLELDNGVRSSASSATNTVGNVLDDWLAGGLSGRSDGTRELYRDTVRPLREPLGDIKLRELTAGDVQQTLDGLANRLSTRTLQVLRNCLERAIRHAEVRDL
jgi:hypothetical protein